jgi:hypothetical protein
MYGAASASPYDSARVTLRGNRHEIYIKQCMLSWFPSANIRDIFYLDIGFQCTFEQLYKEYGYEHDLANVCTEQPVRAHMIAPV